MVDLLFPGCWEMIYVMFSSVLFIDWSFPLESVLGQCHKTAQTNQHWFWLMLGDVSQYIFIDFDHDKWRHMASRWVYQLNHNVINTNNINISHITPSHFHICRNSIAINVDIINLTFAHQHHACDDYREQMIDIYQLLVTKFNLLTSRALK